MGGLARQARAASRPGRFSLNDPRQPVTSLSFRGNSRSGPCTPSLAGHRAKRAARLRWLATLAFAVLLAAPVLTCDARRREIRSRLSGDELALFDRGSRLSGPCWACHDFYGTQNKIAPHLSGLYGRQAGVSSFRGYSEALRLSQIVWDDQTLDRFLADPQRLVPGTTMVSPGLASAGDRAALRFYMKQVTLSK